MELNVEIRVGAPSHFRMGRWWRLWLCVLILSICGSQWALAQEPTDRAEVVVEDVMSWLREPSAISNMLGMRINAVGGEVPTLPSDSIRSQENIVDVHHIRWDRGKFFSRTLVEVGDFGDLHAITKMACGGVHPNYWAITEGVQLICIESEDVLDRNYIGSWTENSVAGVLVVAAQKKVWEFLNLGLLRIRPGSIDWSRDSGQFQAHSLDGRPVSGLLEIGGDGVLEAIQYWYTDEPLPELDLNDISEAGKSSSFNAFRVSFFYGEQSKVWRIPSMFDVSYLISVAKANSLDPTLPAGDLKAHGKPFARYQILSFERSEASLPAKAFSHHQISEGETSPVDMKYAIYSNADGHFRKNPTGGLIPLRTVTKENADRWPGQGGVLGRVLYCGFLVVLGMGCFWWYRSRTAEA